MRPTSITRVAPPRMMRAQPSMSLAGMPRDLARSLPVPPGTRPIRTRSAAPDWSIPLATPPQVPSPPTATMVVNPRATASRATRASSPAARVRPCSTGPPARSAATTGSTRRAPRPFPDAGLKTTKTGSGTAGGSGGLELDQRVEGLHPVAHPQLAERDLADLGEDEVLVEGVLVQAEVARLFLVLALSALHEDLGQVGPVAVLHERLVEVGDRVPGVVADREVGHGRAAHGHVGRDLRALAVEADVDVLHPVRQVPALDGVLARRLGGGAHQVRVEGGLGQPLPRL